MKSCIRPWSELSRNITGDSLEELSDLDSSGASKEKLISCSGKKILKDVMVEQETKKVPQLPYSNNGTMLYEVVASTWAKLLQKLKDVRTWKKDSWTTWTSYKTVWYWDFYGFFTCPNTECAFFLQYNKANKVHFTKTGACKICSIQGDWYSCDARKYTAFVNDNCITCISLSNSLLWC